MSGDELNIIPNIRILERQLYVLITMITSQVNYVDKQGNPISKGFNDAILLDDPLSKS